MWIELAAVGKCVEIKLVYCESLIGTEVIHDNENFGDCKE